MSTGIASEGRAISLVNYEYETAFKCNLLFMPEEEGFSVVCLNLRGVISQGDDYDEALRNAMDAFRETLLYYRESKLQIPWGEVEKDEESTGCFEKSVVVRI